MFKLKAKTIHLKVFYQKAYKCLSTTCQEQGPQQTDMPSWSHCLPRGLLRNPGAWLGVHRVSLELPTPTEPEAGKTLTSPVKLMPPVLCSIYRGCVLRQSLKAVTAIL